MDPRRLGTPQDTGIPTQLLNLNTGELPTLNYHPERATELGPRYQLQVADVLCGAGRLRGGGGGRHPGNERFKVAVAMRLNRYENASNKSEKTAIVKEIVDVTRASGGRFVKQEDDGVFYDVGNVKAREKASNAIRSMLSAKRPKEKKRPNDSEEAAQGSQREGGEAQSQDASTGEDATKTAPEMAHEGFDPNDVKQKKNEHPTMFEPFSQEEHRVAFAGNNEHQNEQDTLFLSSTNSNLFIPPAAAAHASPDATAKQPAATTRTMELEGMYDNIPHDPTPLSKRARLSPSLSCFNEEGAKDAGLSEVSAPFSTSSGRVPFPQFASIFDEQHGDPPVDPLLLPTSNLPAVNEDQPQVALPGKAFSEDSSKLDKKSEEH